MSIPGLDSHGDLCVEALKDPYYFRANTRSEQSFPKDFVVVRVKGAFEVHKISVKLVSLFG